MHKFALYTKEREGTYLDLEDVSIGVQERQLSLIRKAVDERIINSHEQKYSL